METVSSCSCAAGGLLAPLGSGNSFPDGAVGVAGAAGPRENSLVRPGRADASFGARALTASARGRAVFRRADLRGLALAAIRSRSRLGFQVFLRKQIKARSPFAFIPSELSNRALR